MANAILGKNNYKPDSADTETHTHTYGQGQSGILGPATVQSGTR